MTRSRASVCPSLLSRRSPQSGTGSNRPAENKHTNVERESVTADALAQNPILSLLAAVCCLTEDVDEKERSRTVPEVENTGSL